MKEILQKVSYLKGLADGLKVNEETNEGKLLLEVIKVLEDMAFAIEDLDYRQNLIIEDIDEIDEDLGELEEYTYDLDLDLYDDYDDMEDFDFGDLDYDYFDDEEDFDFDDENDDFEEELIIE